MTGARRLAAVLVLTAAFTTAIVTPAATTAVTALPDTPATAIALALVEAPPAAAHYGHYCGSRTHSWTYRGRTWRERLTLDEGTRHVYQLEVWYVVPWWVLTGDRWRKSTDTYRDCATAW